MKVVILLLCLVLIQIFSASADDHNAELSRDATVGMDRQVREAGQKVKHKSSKKEKIGKKNAKVSRRNKSKPSRKKKSKKANGRKNKSKPRGKKKSKKANRRKNKSKPREKKRSKKANGRKNKSNLKGKKKSKKANGRKNSKGRSKGKKGSKKRKSEGKLTKTARQPDTVCLTNLCDKSKKLRNYNIQIRIAKRIQRWVDLMGNKNEKAMTTFKNASSLIARATSNGTECAGGPIPEEAKVAYETLQTCSITASELCDSSKIPGLNISLITDCVPLLEDYVIAYKACLDSCDDLCSCTTDLVLVKATCTKFEAMGTNIKPAREKCTDKKVKGSFVHCRRQERKVAYYVEKCKACPPSITTKAPTSLARKHRQFQRVKN